MEIYLLIGILVASCIWVNETEYISKDDGSTYLCAIFLWPIVVAVGTYYGVKEHIKNK